jgi:uncharacterized protein YbaA (DUF1428 family)
MKAQAYWIRLAASRSASYHCATRGSGGVDEARTIERNDMARYVDGFVIPIPKKSLRSYRRMARKAGVVWKSHGALEYRECVGEDLKSKFGLPFPRLTRLKPGETVLFSWIVYRSRSHRDKVNAKVMKDPRLAKMMDPKAMPFDTKRMTYGGFEVLVDL